MMANSSSSSDDNAPLQAIRNLLEDLNVELKQLVLEENENAMTAENERFHGNESIDSLMKTKLHIESDIESMMQEGLLELPNDKDLLLRLSQEEAEDHDAKNARAVEAYKRKIQKLKEEEVFYNDMIKKATDVEKHLNKVIKTRNKQDAMVELSKRYNDMGVYFKTFREELQYILTDLYPKQDEETSLENTMELLVTKLLKDPQDAYMPIQDGIPESHVSFLLRFNLVRRHPQDASKIRFIDPRS